MSASEHDTSASSVFDYHNRFANAAKTTDSTPGGTETGETSRTDTSFQFEFPDFSHSHNQLGSFLDEFKTKETPAGTPVRGLTEARLGSRAVSQSVTPEIMTPSLSQSEDASTESAAPAELEQSSHESQGRYPGIQLFDGPVRAPSPVQQQQQPSFQQQEVSHPAPSSHVAALEAAVSDPQEPFSNPQQQREVEQSRPQPAGFGDSEAPGDTSFATAPVHGTSIYDRFASPDRSQQRDQSRERAAPSLASPETNGLFGSQSADNNNNSRPRHELPRPPMVVQPSKQASSGLQAPGNNNSGPMPTASSFMGSFGDHLTESSRYLNASPVPGSTRGSTELSRDQDQGMVPSASNSSLAPSNSSQPQDFSRPSPRPSAADSVASHGSTMESRLGAMTFEHRHPKPPQDQQVEPEVATPLASRTAAFPTFGQGSQASDVPGRPSKDEERPVQRLMQPEPARERPNSFFGMSAPVAAVDSQGERYNVSQGYGERSHEISQSEESSGFFPGTRDDADGSSRELSRQSSFYRAGANDDSGLESQGQSQAAKLAAAYHRGEARRQESGSTLGQGTTRSTLAGGTGNAYIHQTNYQQSSGRPASIAPSTSSGPLLDHSHLKPGQQAALLSHIKTLELYRQNAKKTNDPDLIYEFAVFMIDASKSMPEGPTGASGAGVNSKEDVIKEAIGLLKKIAERGHPDAQYFLADCYANGIGTLKGKQDFDRAYLLFVLAAKHGHPDAAYRAGTCYEKGWGCRKDSGKALQFYRKAAAQSHPGAMYRLATAELNGELGLKRSAKEGVKWLKRSAEHATPEFPHALHELALLHERGIDNVLFVDPDYSCELLAQGAEMGYAPSAYKLGVNYEYGRMGCPQDAGLSIHMYNIAAQQNHREACFALTAWYLVGAPGILPQSDTEAYLWAKKAAEQGLAKAEYAIGYFTEMGIGTVKDVKEAKLWLTRAAEHGDKRANQRLTAMGAPAVVPKTGVGAGGKDKDKGRLKAGQHGETASGTDFAALPGARTQPTNAPFPSRVEASTISPAGGPATSYPSPLTMRDQQSAQREEKYLANVAAHQQAQLRAAAIASGQLSNSRADTTPSPSTNGSSRASNLGFGQKPSQASLRATAAAQSSMSHVQTVSPPPRNPERERASTALPGPLPVAPSKAPQLPTAPLSTSPMEYAGPGGASVAPAAYPTYNNTARQAHESSATTSPPAAAQPAAYPTYSGNGNIASAPNRPAQAPGRLSLGFGGPPASTTPPPRPGSAQSHATVNVQGQQAIPPPIPQNRMQHMQSPPPGFNGGPGPNGQQRQSFQRPPPPHQQQQQGRPPVNGFGGPPSAWIPGQQQARPPMQNGQGPPRPWSPSNRPPQHRSSVDSYSSNPSQQQHGAGPMSPPPGFRPMQNGQVNGFGGPPAFQGRPMGAATSPPPQGGQPMQQQQQQFRPPSFNGPPQQQQQQPRPQQEQLPQHPVHFNGPPSVGMGAPGGGINSGMMGFASDDATAALIAHRAQMAEQQGNHSSEEGKEKKKKKWFK